MTSGLGSSCVYLSWYLSKKAGISCKMVTQTFMRLIKEVVDSIRLLEERDFSECSEKLLFKVLKNICRPLHVSRID
jgi:hypothetical protein